MKAFVLGLIMMASAVLGTRAEAGVTGECSIRASIEMVSAQWGFGGISGEGRGKIDCTYSDGSNEVLPIRVDVKGFSVGWGVSRTDVSLHSKPVRIRGRAHELLGRYAMARANAGAGDEGNGGVVKFKATRDSVVIPFEATVRDGDGFELAANIGRIKLSAR